MKWKEKADPSIVFAPCPVITDLSLNLIHVEHFSGKYNVLLHTGSPLLPRSHFPLFLDTLNMLVISPTTAFLKHLMAGGVERQQEKKVLEESFKSFGIRRKAIH